LNQPVHLAVHVRLGCDDPLPPRAGSLFSPRPGSPHFRLALAPRRLRCGFDPSARLRDHHAPMAGTESEKKLITDSGQLLKQGEAFEAELAALKARSEQYFLGIERKPPSTAHRLLKQKVDGLKPAMARTTVVKLKIQNIHQKLQTYERLWTRTCQEMEN